MALKVLKKNVPYIGQQLGALLGNTSSSVKFVCGVVSSLYFLSFSDRAVNLLSVTPGALMPPTFAVWTIFTYCFLEIHFWEVCVDLITLGLCGKLIEPLWGAMEMVTFFAVVNVGVAVLSTSFYIALYVWTSNVDLLFQNRIHGLAGFIAGLSVAVKQIMPDHVLFKTPIGKITNRNIPLCIVLLSLVLYFSGLLEGTNPTMFTTGILVSWIYLRFYQPHSNGTKGDMADNFTFSSFFPNVLQPPISVVCNTIHSGLVKVGICRKTVRKFDMAASPTGVTVTLPGNDPQDMERRRQIALKALYERMNKGEGFGSRKEGGGCVTLAMPAIPLPPPTPLLPPLFDPSTAHPVPPTTTTAQVHHMADG